jgi:HD domain
VRLTEIPIPSSPAARAAAEVLAQYSAPALVNHCVRSYLFAAALGSIEGLEFDHELLYVASLLHDIGLEPAFDSHTMPFEDAGGHVAWVFAAAAGWPADRRTRAAEIIVAHMRGADPSVDSEGHLLEDATGLDISGRDLDRWPRELVVEILAAYPRLDLAARFIACFRDQADRKPDSSAAGAVRSGIADRLAVNPLETLAD